MCANCAMELGDRYDTLYRYTKALSAALLVRDRYTRVHSERVLELSLATGRRAGFTVADLAILQIGAAFHDIGKIGIRDHILLKPGRLDIEESEEMRRHAALGAEIMLATDLDEAVDVARVIRHHHENFDGSGYPDGIAGESIPIASRIIGIADSYDAMALARSYHHGRTHREILAILESERGMKHDPALLRYFLDVVEGSEHRAEG